jgi:hypothetical protein
MDVELVVDLGLFKTNPCDLDLGCGPITKRDPALDFHIASGVAAQGGTRPFRSALLVIALPRSNRPFSPVIGSQ